MHHRIATLAVVAALAPHALSQNKSPQCIKNCTSTLAFSSHCDGDETGAALDRCTCTSFLGSSAAPLVTCVKACPASDQSVFVANIPELCRSDLFPGVTAFPTGTSDSATGNPSASGASQTSPTSSGSPSSTTNPNTGIELRAPGILAIGGLAMVLFL